MESHNELKVLLALISSNLGKFNVEVSDSQLTIKVNKTAGENSDADGNGASCSERGASCSGSDGGSNKQIENGESTAFNRGSIVANFRGAFESDVTEGGASRSGIIEGGAIVNDASGKGASGSGAPGIGAIGSDAAVLSSRIVKTEPSIVKTEASLGIVSPPKTVKIERNPPTARGENDNNNNSLAHGATLPSTLDGSVSNEAILSNSLATTVNYNSSITKNLATPNNANTLATTLNCTTTDDSAATKNPKTPKNPTLSNAKATIVNYATTNNSAATKNSVTSNNAVINRPECRPTVPCRIYIKFSRQMPLTELQLRQYFSRFGSISNANLIRERPSGLLRGFGFVEFYSPDAAKRAIAAGVAFIHGARISIHPCYDRKPNPSTAPTAAPAHAATAAPAPAATAASLDRRYGTNDIPRLTFASNQWLDAPQQPSFYGNRMDYASSFASNQWLNAPQQPPFYGNRMDYVSSFASNQWLNAPQQPSFYGNRMDYASSFSNMDGYVARNLSFGAAYGCGYSAGPQRRQRNHRVNPYRR